MADEGRTDPPRPHVRSQPPPKVLLRFVNPFVRAVAPSRLGRRMRWGVLSFTGRRTGTEYAIPVGIHDVDGVATVFTRERWRLNFRDGAAVTVMQGGQKRRGHGQLVEDSAQVGAALAVALRNAKPRDLALAVDKGYTPTTADLAAIGESMIQIRFNGP
jgi:hypothetical protein